MNDETREDVIRLYAQPEQAGVTGLIIDDLLKKIQADIDDTALTRARMEGFKRYMKRQIAIEESMGAVWDPTRYRQMLADGSFEQAKALLALLDALAAFFEIEEGLE